MTIDIQIKNIKSNSERIKPLVAIRCITYNHEKYISEALDGFVMQQTRFPFIALVHDDASTDNTPKIIEEYAQRYPDIIFPLYEKENLYSKSPKAMADVLDKAIINTGAEFVAFCEGDDYWIDPLKLQKQIDFLEKNPEYGMCYTSFNIKNEIKNSFRYDLFKTDPENYPSTYVSEEEFILKKGYVCPPSWVIRKEFWKTNLLVSLDGTFVRFSDLLHSTKVKMIPDVTCVYREIPESASRSSNYEKIYLRKQNLFQTQLNLIEIFNLSSDLKDLCTEKYYRECLKSWVINGKHEDVKKAYFYLNKKNVKEKALFAIDFLRLNFILQTLKRIRRSILKI